MKADLAEWCRNSLLLPVDSDAPSFQFLKKLIQIRKNSKNEEKTKISNGNKKNKRKREKSYIL